MDISLSSPIIELKGVGSFIASKLHKLGIEYVKDLLFYIPSKYRDTSNLLNISTLIERGEGTIVAKVESISSFKAGRFLITKAKLIDDSGKIEAVWFNQPYIIMSIKRDCYYFIDGKVKIKDRFVSLQVREFQPVDETEYEETSSNNTADIIKVQNDIQNIQNKRAEIINEKNSLSNLSKINIGGITPFYPTTAGLSQKIIRKNIYKLLKIDKVQIADSLPSQYLSDSKIKTTSSSEKKFMKLDKAIEQIHFPENTQQIEVAKNRLALDEMLNIAFDIEYQNQYREKKKSYSIKAEGCNLNDFISDLPYPLTDDQQKVLEEILIDMRNSKPMRRVLNGDVGSGKTIIALITSLLTIQNGYSVILIAPTTILAKQHYETFNKILGKYMKQYDFSIDLLMSGNQLVSFFCENKKSILIGTHAILFKKDINQYIGKVGLVVVDEQHRFGVLEREYLKEMGDKKNVPHYLSMTATPIPRTLTQILYGDSDISIIKQMPKNRIPVKSYLVPQSKRNDCYRWIKQNIIQAKTDKNIQQAFIIFPLVDDSDKMDALSATDQYEKLKSSAFKGLSVGLLHGKMKEIEKQAILTDFRDKKYDVLVATSVIEVGIDIPDATIMVIEDAEHFGLAQLHQFRGRVGRGDKQSHCLVVASKNVSTNSDSYKRLEYFVKHSSGFDVAEYDLKSRGPGEVYGLAQSGIPKLKVADIMDIQLVKRARDIAKKMINEYNPDQINDIRSKLFH